MKKFSPKSKKLLLIESNSLAMFRRIEKIICTIVTLVAMVLLVSCGKKRSYHQGDLDIASTSKASSDPQNVPVLNHPRSFDDLDSDTPEFDSIKRFSYEAFTKKIVPLTATLDFPIPVNFTLQASPVKKSETKGACLIYEGDLSQKKIVSFYLHEMRKAGWSVKNLSTSREGLLVCSRKATQVVVSLRKARTISSNNHVEPKKTQLLLFFTKES
ncbi:hypothetical protein JST56_02795 [Candidatus Dependentiae bacterium]|nr:hypothetical protein [Candidatus Dependentiae bacterium]